MAYRGLASFLPANTDAGWSARDFSTNAWGQFHKSRKATSMMRRRIASYIVLAFALFAATFAVAQLPGMSQPKHYPWSDAALSPDERADLVIKEMTLDQKISLLHGVGAHFFR